MLGSAALVGPAPPALCAFHELDASDFVARLCTLRESKKSYGRPMRVWAPYGVRLGFYFHRSTSKSGRQNQMPRSRAHTYRARIAPSLHSTPGRRTKSTRSAARGPGPRARGPGPWATAAAGRSRPRPRDRGIIAVSAERP